MVSGFFFIFFFIFHYGFFVFVQTGIFTSITGLSKGDFNPLYFISNLYSYLNMDTKIVLYMFVLMYGVRMITDFVITGKYKQTSMGVLMFQPYIRIFIQQFVVILGSMFLAFGAGKIFMLIFICVKIYFEIFINYDMVLEQAERMQK